MKKHVENAPGYDIGHLICSVRGARVILDKHLARLYELSTKRLNEQIRRNLPRFPSDFAFQLSKEEWLALRSKLATLNKGRGQHPKYLPYVFTEHGALMAATVLSSPRAVAMSVYVIRAFVKMREELAANGAILKRLAEIDKKLLLHDFALHDIFQKLRPLLEPPSLPPKPEIGFHVKEDTVPYRIRKTARPARLNSRL